MRFWILAAAAAVTLGACQPAAEPQPVETPTAPDTTAKAPTDAAPAVTPEPTQEPQVAAPAPASPPRASAPRPTRPTPTPAPTPPPADPMAGHDMSKMGGMTMPPKQ